MNRKHISGLSVNRARIVPVSWRSCFVVLVFIFAFPALGQTLYRCPGQGANGATLIQDRPCPDGRPAATVLDGREVRVSRARQLEIASERQRLERDRARQGATVRRPVYAYNAGTQAQRRRQACDSAKAWRDAQRRNLSLNRTYEQLSALDRSVREQCKGVR